MKRVIAIVVGSGACSSTPPATRTPVPPAAPNQLVQTTTYEAGAMHLRIDGTDVDLAQLPVADWLGLPMAGSASIHADVRVPVVHGMRDLTGTDGTIAFTCTGCQLGDDATRLVPHLKNPRSQSFAADGIQFGHLALDRVSIGVRIQHGQVDVTEWNIGSPDFELVVSGHGVLGDTLDESTVEACLRFRGTDALLKRDPHTYAVIQTTGANVAGDGKFNIRVTGPWQSVKRLSQVCDGSQPLAAVEPEPITRPELPPPDAGSASDQPVAYDTAIRKLDDTNYEIDRALITQTLENPMAVAKGGRVVPAIKDGKPYGFKLYAIKPGSLFDKLGWLNGDTIVSVNGFDMTSADKALEVYTKLREAAQLQVVLERRGKQLTLHYAIK